MSSTATAAPIQITFPKVSEGSTDLVVPTAPQTPANAVVASVALLPPAQAKKQLVCKNLLVGETLKAAQAEAAKLLDEMLANTQVFMAYGTRSLEGVNALVDRLLHNSNDVKIPELTALMKGLNSEMRGVKRKYDPSDPAVLKKYENWKGGIGRFVRRGKTMLELLMEDVTSIETQINKVGTQLKGRQLMLMDNVGHYDQLYIENEAEIGKVIYAIAVMELIRDLAAQRAADMVIGDASIGDRGLEQRSQVTDLVSNMEIKIAEYKGRLFIAWGTSPSVRNMRTLNVGLAERINELLCVTIPTMKATIVQWRMLAQTEEAARMAEVVQGASNEWFQAAQAAAAIAVPRIAETINTPSLTVASIAAMADSLDAQANGIIAAMELGARLREEQDAAIMEAGQVIADSTAKVSDALIERVTGIANKSLEITTTVS